MANSWSNSKSVWGDEKDNSWTSDKSVWGEWSEEEEEAQEKEKLKQLLGEL